jgi:hypothetical protein
MDLEIVGGGACVVGFDEEMIVLISFDRCGDEQIEGEVETLLRIGLDLHDVVAGEVDLLYARNDNLSGRNRTQAHRHNDRQQQYPKTHSLEHDCTSDK